MLTDNPAVPMILVVEDDENHADLIRRSLGMALDEYRLERVGTLGAARSIMDQQLPDLVLADFRLPDGEGSELLTTAKGICPVVLMTSQGNEQLAVDILKGGAQDYVAKSPAAFAAMPRVVQRILHEWALIQGKKRAEELLKVHQINLELQNKELLRVQAELELLHKSLEARVAEMVADLRRKDLALIQQNRQAAMGEMIGHIAHQWRQPLNTISLIVQNVQGEFDSGTLTGDDVHHDVHEIMEILLHMSRTIDDFRNFFREDKEKCPFLLSTAVSSALALVSASLKNNNIRVEIAGDTTVTATGYQNEYAQVLLNILSNSRDAGIEHSVSEPLIHAAWNRWYYGLIILRFCGGANCVGTAFDTVRLSIHIDWSTGEPTPIYGPIRSWLNFMSGYCPVRNTTAVLFKTDLPSYQYCSTPSFTAAPLTMLFIFTYASTRCQSPL